jgi:hypothetical protein
MGRDFEELKLRDDVKVLEAGHTAALKVGEKLEPLPYHMPHKYPRGAELVRVDPPHGGPPDVILRVKGRKAYEDRKGLWITYRCEQVRGGITIGNLVDVAEEEVKLVGAEA